MSYIPVKYIRTQLENTTLSEELEYNFHEWSRNCFPFRSTRVHPQFLVGFVLLDLQFFMCNPLQIVVVFHLASVVYVLLRLTDSDYPIYISSSSYISLPSLQFLISFKYIEKCKTFGYFRKIAFLISATLFLFCKLQHYMH